MTEVKYKGNDHWVYCDYSGFKVRASDTIIQWNGLRVFKGFAEATRHPQDLLQAFPDNPLVPNPRPDPGNVFIEDT